LEGQVEAEVDVQAADLSGKVTGNVHQCACFAAEQVVDYGLSKAGSCWICKKIFVIRLKPFPTQWPTA